MAEATNIKVAIRLRPLNKREVQGGQFRAWKLSNGSTLFPCSSDGKPLPNLVSFSFDRVFEEASTTDQVYQDVAHEIVSSCMKGINGTIFAYGQTSSGKTHTMQGNAKEPGIIPKAIFQIFHEINQNPEREYLLRVSYLEIYNENIRDLLNPENDNLKIHENPNREIFVGNITETVVLSPEEVAQLMIKGEGKA
ncbi:hypothetical protein HK096_003301 [Nowakowskiella sp. JEL0078]|nr:hypothetical protein HK096_003301 [Nowakowskiella sp. JEL0078]